MTQAPYYWVKKIESTLKEAKKIPLWGKLPSFPLEECAQKLSKALNLPEMSLTLKNTQFRPADELLKGMGKNPMSITFEASPFSEVAHFVFPAEDAARLNAMALSNDPFIKSFSDKNLQEGYLLFLSLEAIAAINNLSIYQKFSFKLATPAPLSKDGGLCIDVEITIKDTILWGRLICSSAFLKALRTYGSEEGVSIVDSELRHQIDVDLQFQVGRTKIPLESLKKVAIGDFIRLDHCNFDPIKHQGSVNIMLQSIPLFDASIKNGQLTIVDYTYQEDNMAPPKDYDDEDEDLERDDEDEDDLDEDDDEDYEEDEDLEDEDDEEESDEDEDEDFEEDEELEDEDEEEEDEEELEDEEEENKADVASASHKEVSVGQIISTEHIPVTLTVEIARLSMSLDKVLELKPGNVVDLPVSVDQPLDVRMNGKKIAKAELIKMGDVLGIKILNIGAV